MAHRIAIVVFDDCFASNVVGLVDLLHSANLIAARRDPPLDVVFEWKVLSTDGRPAPSPSARIHHHPATSPIASSNAAGKRRPRRIGRTGNLADAECSGKISGS
jgi:hypothetical protein